MVKWMFLTGLNRTTVENCGKMDGPDTVDFVVESSIGVVLE